MPVIIYWISLLNINLKNMLNKNLTIEKRKQSKAISHIQHTYEFQ
jgi:hypothetical protein